MEPRFVTKDSMILVGFSFYGDPLRLSPGWTEENEIGRLWQRFMAYMAQHGQALQAALAEPGVGYEVHVYDEDTQTTGEFEVFVGVELTVARLAPLEMVLKVLPATTYAVFALEGEAIVGDWPLDIYGKWLPSSGYELAHQFHIQYHDGRFQGLDRLAESSLDVYVPVRPRP